MSNPKQITQFIEKKIILIFIFSFLQQFLLQSTFTSLITILLFINQMLEILLEKWSNSSFSQKIQIIKSAIIELILLTAITLFLFWSMFFAIWILTIIIGIQPYYQIHKPNFHVRTLNPNNLVVTYVNYQIKNQICQMGQSQDFFSQLTVPYHEFCNIQQENLPKMKSPVDINLYSLDNSKISYITGCIKHKGKSISCQKYQSNSQLSLFKHLQFYNLYYMQIQLHLRDSSQSPTYSPQVQFNQKTWFITKIIKKYYSIFTFVFTFGITGLLTISIVILRLVKICQKQLNKNQENILFEKKLKEIQKRNINRKQNKKQDLNKNEQKMGQKQKKQQNKNQKMKQQKQNKQIHIKNNKQNNKML